jgi:FHS family glucose/mannose:H+ symporter-like MFS transporter
MITKAAVIAAHLAFVLTGTVTTLLGPLLPVLAARWSLDDARTGYFFTAQFAGSMAGVGISGALVSRYGFQVALSIGLAVMALGVGGLGAPAWSGALLSVGCYGVGLGIAIPSTNLLVAEAAPDRRSAALNILNLAWGIGAVLAPPTFASLTARHGANAFIFGLAAALAAAMVGIVLLASPTQRAERREVQPTRSAPPRWWRSPVFFVFGALFFVYVGTENALAGWVAVYGQRLEPSAAAASTPAFFWAALLVGRALAPTGLRWLGEALVVQSGLLLAALGVGLLLSATTLTGVMLSTSLCGLGLAAVFPTTIAQLSRQFAGASVRAAAAAFALAGLGGATVPWLVGVCSTNAGSLRAGLMIPLIGCLAMITLHAYRSRITA